MLGLAGKKAGRTTAALDKRRVGLSLAPAFHLAKMGAKPVLLGGPGVIGLLWNWAGAFWGLKKFS